MKNNKTKIKGIDLLDLVPLNKSENLLTKDTFKKLKNLKKNRWVGTKIKNISMLQNVPMDEIVRPKDNHVRSQECENTKRAFKNIISEELYVPENYIPPVVRLIYDRKRGKKVYLVIDGNHRLSAHQDVGSTHFGAVILVEYEDGLDTNEIRTIDEYIGTYFNQAPETYARKKGNQNELVGIMERWLNDKKNKNMSLEEFLEMAKSLKQSGKDLSPSLRHDLEQAFVGKRDKHKSVTNLSEKERNKCVRMFKNKMFENHLTEDPVVFSFYCKEHYDTDYDMRLSQQACKDFVKQAKLAERNGKVLTTDVQNVVTTIGNSNYEKIKSVREFKKRGAAIYRVLSPFYEACKYMNKGHKFYVNYSFTNQIENDNFENYVDEYVDNALKNGVNFEEVIDVKNLLEKDYNDYGK